MKYFQANLEGFWIGLTVGMAACITPTTKAVGSMVFLPTGKPVGSNDIWNQRVYPLESEC
jgi:hypothetical protein